MYENGVVLNVRTEKKKLAHILEYFSKLKISKIWVTQI